MARACLVLLLLSSVALCGCWPTREDSLYAEGRSRQLDDDDSSWNIRFHVATKTPYWPQASSSDYTEAPVSCSPVLLNLLARHGARYPGGSDIASLSDLAAVMHANAEYLKPRFAWMATWENPYLPQNEDLLTLTGQLNHYNLADRLMSDLDPLLSQRYYPYVYDMQSTQKSRTGRSGNAFGYRMQEHNGFLDAEEGQAGYMPFYIYSDSQNEDVRLLFFDNCPTYTTMVDCQDNPNATAEARLYEHTAVAGVASGLSHRLGVYPHWNLTTSQVKLMYKQCGYDLAIYGINDRFCLLFDEVSGGVLEYYNDLKNYYTKFYGYDINYQPACVLLKDFFQVFDGVVSGSQPLSKAKLRFAHAETLLPFVALLGLFKDPQPLMANWTEEQIAGRAFRSSYISPFAGNVQAVLYECDDDWLVRFLVNEKEVIIPGCDGVYCSYAQLQEIFDEALHCQYEDLCFSSDTPCQDHCTARPAFAGFT